MYVYNHAIKLTLKPDVYMQKRRNVSNPSNWATRCLCSQINFFPFFSKKTIKADVYMTKKNAYNSRRFDPGPDLSQYPPILGHFYL